MSLVCCAAARWRTSIHTKVRLHDIDLVIIICSWHIGNCYLCVCGLVIE